MDKTRIARPYFEHITRAAESWQGNTRMVQTHLLERLLARGRSTKWAASKGLDEARTYDDLRRAIPVPVQYAELRPWVMRMIAGEKDVLWPGRTRNFAQSSGTSDGKSKYIPITNDSLTYTHYAGGAHVVASYLNLYSDSRIFSGKGFILGGSFANELNLPPRVKVGDLSATLIDRINPLAEMVRIPSKKVALMADWEQKLPALIEASAGADVTNISGVPSWFLTVLKGVLAKTGASTLREVWPNLEVFFHGGISMAPYREQYEQNGIVRVAEQLILR